MQSRSPDGSGNHCTRGCEVRINMGVRRGHVQEPVEGHLPESAMGLVLLNLVR